MADEVLERRVSALEQEVEGEKLVTRHILEQTWRNGDDLAEMKARAGSLDTKVVSVDKKLGSVSSQVGKLSAEFRAWRSELPKLIAETMRDVLRERDRERDR